LRLAAAGLLVVDTADLREDGSNASRVGLERGAEFVDFSLGHAAIIACLKKEIKWSVSI
jgi:hypothetical protein